MWNFRMVRTIFKITKHFIFILSILILLIIGTRKSCIYFKDYILKICFRLTVNIFFNNEIWCFFVFEWTEACKNYSNIGYINTDSMMLCPCFYNYLLFSLTVNLKVIDIKQFLNKIFSSFVKYTKYIFILKDSKLVQQIEIIYIKFSTKLNIYLFFVNIVLNQQVISYRI